MRSIKTLLLSFIILFITLNSAFTSGQKETEKQETISIESSLESQVSNILAGYDIEDLSDEEIASIHEAFKEEGIKGGEELNAAIKSIGVDPEILNNQPPASSTNISEGDENDHSENIEAHSKNKEVKIYDVLSTEYGPSDFTLSSSAVVDGELLLKYQCEKKVDDKENSIPLNWENIPEGTKSLAIIMYHFPNPDNKAFVNSYLLLWGIEPTVSEIPYSKATSDEWFMGSNKDCTATSYTSPCSSGAGTHEYCITLFALSEYPEGLPKESSLDVDFSTFMDSIDENNIMGKAELKFSVTR